MSGQSRVRVPEAPGHRAGLRALQGPLRRVLAEALVGVLFAVSFAVPWTGSGPGSTLSGYAAVGLVGSGAVSVWVPAWVSVPLAVLPGLGVLLVALSLVLLPPARRWAAVVFGVAAVVGLALALATLVSSVLSPGPGLWLVVAAVVVGLVVHSGAGVRRRLVRRRSGEVW
jgi:hypothetical protein